MRVGVEGGGEDAGEDVCVGVTVYRARAVAIITTVGTGTGTGTATATITITITITITTAIPTSPLVPSSLVGTLVASTDSMSSSMCGARSCACAVRAALVLRPRPNARLWPRLLARPKLP